MTDDPDMFADTGREDDIDWENGLDCDDEALYDWLDEKTPEELFRIAQEMQDTVEEHIVIIDPKRNADLQEACRQLRLAFDRTESFGGGPARFGFLLLPETCSGLLTLKAKSFLPVNIAALLRALALADHLRIMPTSPDTIGLYLTFSRLFVDLI